MPQVAEKIDERILKILGLKDTFDLDYSDYSSLLKEKLAANRIQKVLSADEDKLILDEFKRVKSKTGKFKGTKKKIGASVETKKPSSGYYKSPFAKEQVKRQQAVKPNTKVTALSTYVDKTSGQKISPGALMKRDGGSLVKPLQEQSKKIAKVANILEASKKQENKIESEKKKDELKLKDEEKKRETEAKLEKKIELPSLTKLADPILKPVKGIFQRILEAFGWLAAGWLVDKAIVWMSDPNNQQKLDSLGQWFNDTKEKLESPESQKRFKTVTKFLREHWLALFGSAGVMLLWSNGLVRFSVKLLGSIVKATGKIAVAVGKMLANLAIRNPKAAAAFAAATAGLYLANKEKVDAAALPYLKGAKSFVDNAIIGGTTVVKKTSEFVDAGDKLFKVGKYSEDYGKNDGGVIGLNSGGTVPVMLTKGEVVVPPNKARQIGYGNLYAMNSLGNRRNEGGPILPFNMGGGVKVVPGRGPNVDSVRDRLPVGSFVLQRPAVDAMGGPRAFRGYNTGGAINTVAQYGTPQQRALLDTISWAEGTFTKNREEGYKIMFTGKRFQAPPWKHPRKINSGGGHKSDAAGRYQYLSTTWDDVARRINATDFSPSNQDKGALNLAEGRNKSIWSELNSKGLTNNIMHKMSGIWASFPKLDGASAYGQPVKKGAKLVDFYNKTLSGAGPGTGLSPTGLNNTDTPEASSGSAGGMSSGNPLDFFGLVRTAIEKISNSNTNPNEGKNKGGLIKLLNSGGVANPFPEGSYKGGPGQKFGDPRPYGGHAGIDITENTPYKDDPKRPIYAAKAGKVISDKYQKSGYLSGLMLDHGDGSEARYLHMTPFKNIGDSVDTGEQVGKLIDLGNQTHLHLEYYNNKKMLDPLEFLRGASTGNYKTTPERGTDEDTPSFGEVESPSIPTPSSPLDFFSVLRTAVETIGGKESVAESDSKLKTDIKKISTTPPSKTKPQSTVSSDMMTLPPDVVKTGKPSVENNVQSQLPKPTQKTSVPSVPSSDMNVVNPSKGGFQWSYAEYYGIK